MELGDGLKKLLLAGVGTVAVTAEKSKEILDELVKKGELTVEQGKVLNQELKHNIKETIKTKTTPAPKAPKEDIKDTLAKLSPEQLAEDIRVLRNECRENRENLHNKMKYSKAKLVGRISEAYERVDQVIQEVQQQLGISFAEEQISELSAENKILMAEYLLDFAMLAADHALLTSLEAIKAQKEQPVE